MHPQLPGMSRFRVGLFVVLSVVAAVGSTGAVAQSGIGNDVFVVRGVQVDETAASAADARAAARASGQAEAARRLIDRLTRSVYRGQLGEIDAGTAELLVDSLEVANERRSDVRYLADLTVAFRPEAVRQFLRSAGVPFTEVRSRPVLVVPVLDRGGAYVLWEEPNPWRQAWQNHPTDIGLVPVVTPIGDLSDLSGLTAEQAVDADVGALGAMADRYGAGTSVVAIARISGDPDSASQQVDVTAIRVGRLDEEPIFLTIGRAPNEEPEVFLERVTGAVIEALDDDWKAANAVSFEESNRLHAAVPLSDIAGWIEVRRRLSGVPAVSQVRLLALTADTAEIEIDYFGDAVRLARALERFDLILEETGLPGQFEPGQTGLVFPPVPTHIVRLPGV